MNKEIIRFIIVGCINTIVGTSIMFIAYNLIHLSYWSSTILNYTLASILSYYLNKYYTFSNKGKNSSISIFVINIVICYLFAYIPSKFIIKMMFSEKFSTVFLDNLSMIVGMVLFTMFNFLGQKLVVFREAK